MKEYFKNSVNTKEGTITDRQNLQKIKTDCVVCF